MSDADDAEPPGNDPGGFDKEAERERLREKYERDKEARQETQRMSELLLQGATMTNQHCEECGNPIFRYDGREFCSVCDDPTGASAEAAASEPTGGDPGEETATDRDRSASDPTPESPPADADASLPGQAERSRTAPPEGDGSADVGPARRSLVRTLTALSQSAAATEDVRRRREFLEAAREAAEAIEAVDRLR